MDLHLKQYPTHILWRESSELHIASLNNLELNHLEVLASDFGTNSSETGFLWNLIPFLCT
jgi:hypothetical protein